MDRKKHRNNEEVKKDEATDQIMLDEISWWWIAKIAIRATAVVYTGNIWGGSRLLWQLHNDVKTGKCYEKRKLSSEFSSITAAGVRTYTQFYWQEIKDLLASLLV